MNYEALVLECYFVDNTRHLHALEAVKTPMFLRQKRFEKSARCSLLAHCYDVNLKDRFGFRNPKFLKEKGFESQSSSGFHTGYRSCVSDLNSHGRSSRELFCRTS